jgi:hypothetical protein
MIRKVRNYIYGGITISKVSPKIRILIMFPELPDRGAYEEQLVNGGIYKCIRKDNNNRKTLIKSDFVLIKEIFQLFEVNSTQKPFVDGHAVD